MSDRTRFTWPVRLSALALRDWVSFQKFNRADPAIASFCLCRLWLDTIHCSSKIWLPGITPSNRSNRIDGVINDSVDIEGGDGADPVILLRFDSDRMIGS